MAKDTKETMLLELPGAELGDFRLGDKVQAMVKGKVIELRAPRTVEFDDGEEEEIPPSLGIEVIGNSKVIMAGNEFAELAEDEDDD